MLPSERCVYFVYREKEHRYRVSRFVAYNREGVLYSVVERTVFFNDCVNCHRPLAAHLDGWCLFGADRFSVGSTHLWGPIHAVIPVVFKKNEHVHEGIKRTVDELNAELDIV